MADPQTNLRVRISGDLKQFNSSLQTLRGNVTSLKGALAGAFAGLSSAALIGGVIRATAESEKVMAQLEARLKSTGGAAGLTKDELVDMASGLQRVTTYGDEAIISAEAMLLTFTKLGRDVFPGALEATLNLATGMGTDLQAAAVQVGKALNDPVKGVTALSKAGVQFSKGQRDLIGTLVETGRTADAQRIILRELETQFGGAARAARETLGGAFEALKEAAGDLLEGDSGSLNGIRTAIEELTATLQSPEVKEGFATMARGLATVATAAVNMISKVAGATRFVAEEIASRVVGPTLDDQVRIEQAIERQQRLIDQLDQKGTGAARRNTSAYADAQRAELRRLQAMLAMRQQMAADAARLAKPPAEPGASTPSGPDPVVIDPDDAERAAKKAEQLRTKLKELQAQHEENLRKLRDEEIAREEALQGQLDEAETALLRAAGNEADAAFRDIDAKYVALLQRLRANGNDAGVQLVNELINVEKARARLDEFQAQFNEALGGFDRAEGKANALAAAGILSPGEAETRIEGARQSSLATLTALRERTMAYYATLSGRDAQLAMQAVDEMDQHIAELSITQDKWIAGIGEQATGPLVELFDSFAQRTKSAKDLFSDFVQSFISGVSRMASQQLGTSAVQAFTSFLSSGVHHAGGIAGAGGTVRSSLSPLLFAGAPRYHSGGLAGLGPGEVAAVLRKGEEVLTEKDPRHVRNGGGVRAGAGGNVIVNVHNNGNGQVETRESMQGGDRVIDVIIEAAVTATAADIAKGGRTARAIGSRFGVNQVGVTRG